MPRIKLKRPPPQCSTGNNYESNGLVAIAPKPQPHSQSHKLPQTDHHDYQNSASTPKPTPTQTTSVYTTPIWLKRNIRQRQEKYAHLKHSNRSIKRRRIALERAAAAAAASCAAGGSTSTNNKHNDDITLRCNFRPSSIVGFWECSNCSNVQPRCHRMTGCVLYSREGPPNEERVLQHSYLCRNLGSFMLTSNGDYNKGSSSRSVDSSGNENQRNNDKYSHSLYSKIYTTVDEEDEGNDGVLGGDMVLPLPTSMQHVHSDDKLLVPSGLSFVFSQFVPCKLSKRKPRAKTDHMKEGYPGLACRYCIDDFASYLSRKELVPSDVTGRCFFFSSPTSMGNNFGHMTKHLLECNGCPLKVKNCVRKKRDQDKSNQHQERRSAQYIKESRALKQEFLKRIFDRLHTVAPPSDRTNDDNDGLDCKSSQKEQQIDKENVDEEDKENRVVCQPNKLHHDPYTVSLTGKDASFAYHPNPLTNDQIKVLVTPYMGLIMDQMRSCNLVDRYQKADAEELTKKYGPRGIVCRFCSPFRMNTRMFLCKDAKDLACKISQMAIHLRDCKYNSNKFKEELNKAKAAHLQIRKSLPKENVRKFWDVVYSNHCDGDE